MVSHYRRFGVEMIVQDVDVLGVGGQCYVGEPGGSKDRAPAAGDGSGTETVHEVGEVFDEGEARVRVDGALVDAQHVPRLVDHLPRGDGRVSGDTRYHVGQPLAEPFVGHRAGGGEVLLGGLPGRVAVPGERADHG